MGEVLLRSHLQVPGHVRWGMEAGRDNVIELKLCVEGQAHRLNFLIYEVESYPDSGGIMMGEDGESELVEAINELLGDREHLELNEVLSSAMQVLKVDAPELELQDSDEDLVSDEGTGIMDDSYERCNRPGWKKMKWQEVEDQRLSVREKRRKGEPPELTNEELKAAGEQIFNSKEAFSILSNELYSLQTQMTQGIQADAVDFNVYHWAVRLRGFEGCLAEDLKQLQASQGYDFVELRVFFKEDLHPFYPPSFALIRPRLQGRRSVRGDEIKKEREDRAGVTEDFMGVIGQQTSQNPWVEKMLFDPRTTDAVLNEEILNPWVVTNLEGAMAIAGLCQLLYK
ncbi:Putative ubiquitin-conjugating enzyme E2 [Durusdinium trenchii]|uniref:Ubiquitin-conjugating enzyme E2 n=1 Tax=Durusdinium trenchii TaxID=1381693 RepID=A0ABP0RE18_9DINO